MTANPKLASDQKNLGNQGAFIDDNALLPGSERPQCQMVGKKAGWELCCLWWIFQDSAHLERHEGLHFAGLSKASLSILRRRLGVTAVLTRPAVRDQVNSAPVVTALRSCYADSTNPVWFLANGDQIHIL